MFDGESREKGVIWIPAQPLIAVYGVITYYTVCFVLKSVDA